MKKRVFIIHGWEATPESNWFPWLKSELVKRGYQAEVPQMPDTLKPNLDTWLGYMEKIIGIPDNNTYLVGHSLGVIAILRYLEKLNNGKARAAILVSGFPEPIGFKELDSFFPKPLDYEKIINRSEIFIAINSSNDPYVPVKNGYLLKDNLNAELIIIENGGHLNADDRYFKLPIVLEKILSN